MSAVNEYSNVDDKSCVLKRNAETPTENLQVAKIQRVAETLREDESPISCLPNELLLKILYRLDLKDMPAACSVSRLWQTLMLDVIQHQELHDILLMRQSSTPMIDRPMLMNTSSYLLSHLMSSSNIFLKLSVLGVLLTKSKYNEQLVEKYGVSQINIATRLTLADHLGMNRFQEIDNKFFNEVEMVAAKINLRTINLTQHEVLDLIQYFPSYEAVIKFCQLLIKSSDDIYTQIVNVAGQIHDVFSSAQTMNSMVLINQYCRLLNIKNQEMLSLIYCDYISCNVINPRRVETAANGARHVLDLRHYRNHPWGEAYSKCCELKGLSFIQKKNMALTLISPGGEESNDRAFDSKKIQITCDNRFLRNLGFSQEEIIDFIKNRFQAGDAGELMIEWDTEYVEDFLIEIEDEDQRTQVASFIGSTRFNNTLVMPPLPIAPEAGNLDDLENPAAAIGLDPLAVELEDF